MSSGGGDTGTDPSSGPIRVLHVDDDPDMLELATTFLGRERPDVSVTTAAGAAAGLDALEDEAFDCVVSDYEMPGTDGLQFLEAVRERHPDLPFVLFTGKGSEEIASEAIKAGVTDYLQKRGGSEQYAVLANRIENAVERYRAERALEETRRWHQRLIEESTDVIIVVDPDGTVTYVSPSVEVVLGYDPVEPLGTNAVEYVHPEDREAVEERHEAVLAGKDAVPPIQFRCAHADGTWVVLESRSRNLLSDPTIEGVVVYVRDVSVQRARQRELHRYERIVEASGDAVYALDTDGRITFVNEAFESLTGYAASAVQGEHVSFAMGEEDVERVRARIRELLGGDGTTHFTYEFEFHTKDGGRVPVENHVALLTDEEGAFVGTTGVLRDVSARKEHERELARYARMVGAMGDGVYALDAEGRLVECNEYLAELAGYDREEMVGAPAATWYDEEDVERFERAIRGLLDGDGGTVETVEATLHPADGDDVDVEVNLTLMPTADGGFRGTVGVIRDVTERKERERELARFETMANVAGDMVYILDTEGRFEFVNDAAVTMTGYGRDELVGEHVRLFMEEEDIAVGRELINRLLREGVSPPGGDSFEWTLHTAEGETIPCETHVTLLREDGEWWGTVGVVRDVSERKEREETLEWYETIVEATGDQIYSLDTQGNFTYINQALVSFWGYDEEEIVGEHISEFMGEEDVEAGEALIQELLQSADRRTGTYELTAITRDGRRVPVENHIAKLTDEDGNYRGSTGVLRDVSERKEREEALRRQNERLDRFAKVVSHDLRNPLNVAAGRVQMERKQHDSENLEKTQEALLRMDDIVEGVLSLAREGQQVVDVDEVLFRPCVDDAWWTIEAPSATLSTRADLGAIVADRSRLQQLFENLFRNAVEHAGPDVTVEVGRLDDDAGPNGFYVEDDGPGIPRAERTRIFEFGRSREGGGTGLGLAIVEDIAEAHDWEVAACEGEAGGARFEVTGVEWVDGG